MEESLELWFREEILPHEAALMRYLRQRPRWSLDPEDLRNEIYVRLLESAQRSRPSAPKAFLFGTARHLLIDLARRNRIVAIELKEDLDALNLLIDERSPEQHVSGRQQLQRLAAIFRRLPLRAREILWMRRIEGLSQREAAARAGLSEEAVEKQLHRGLKFLADALFGSPSVGGCVGSAEPVRDSTWAAQEDEEEGAVAARAPLEGRRES